jgi:hypothetical protein
MPCLGGLWRIVNRERIGGVRMDSSYAFVQIDKINANIY